MYLRYIQIVNYKNLKKVRFEFNKGANTVIGENDAGKSNAMTALRILLDNEYFYNRKLLKESDFSRSLGDWRGHWIIISAFFDEITDIDREHEICAEISPEEENANFLSSFIRCENTKYGTVTLFIRPNKTTRKALHNAGSLEDFNQIRSGVKISDYEFYYTSRSQADFTDSKTYESIVGNIDKGKYSDPDNEDANVIGAKADILDIWQHISLCYIDALRDAESELRKPRNPIKRVFDAVYDEIRDEDIEIIQSKIRDLNHSLSEIPQISDMGSEINNKLQNIVGLVYSPEINIESRLKEDISSIARYLSVTTNRKENVEQLGLGHLNILYIALKLVEFDVNRNHEILNIMVVEEPEAHIHTHIQKSLFDGLQLIKNYTQVIMTTHSTHIADVSNIQNVNIMKVHNKVSAVMRPTNGLDIFGKKKLSLKDISLSKSLERYLDAKRSVLLFSKGVILVEGDAEEIMIPAMVKKSFGISLDELGIGLINIGSVSFEYIASVFGEERLMRYCSIVTDLDAAVHGCKKGRKQASDRGISRKWKLDDLFGNNPWVNSFFAPHTFEVDFFNYEKNRKYIKKILEQHYVRASTVNKHYNALFGDEAKRYDTVLTIANAIKKGWLATMLSEAIDCNVEIPRYIIHALVFSSQEVFSPSIAKKMLLHVLTCYCPEKELYNRVVNSVTDSEINSCVLSFMQDHPKSCLSKFFKYNKELTICG